MKITIHRGSHEIGGTCIELVTSSTKILLDAGLPLSLGSASIAISSFKPDAVVISHPHQDHYGLIDTIDQNTPVYIGNLAKSLLDATRLFLNDPTKPLYTNNFQFYDKWQSFSIGDFKLTPYLVDHSSVDAYGFLIEAEGKRIFYSGDFRGHGKKSKLFDYIIKNPPADIDLLFMEGTMLERDNSEFPNEVSVQAKIQQIIENQNNISFLITSSQNIDRLVSAYNACVDCSKILVIDFYTAWVLEHVKKVSPGVRAMDWQNIAVLKDGYSSGRQYGVMAKDRSRFGKFMRIVFEHTVTGAELHECPSRYLMLGKLHSGRVIQSFVAKESVKVIYSQWQGYLKYTDAEYYGAEAMNAFKQGLVAGVEYHYAHTSGHATVEDLRSFAKALSPKVLVPIHTEHADAYIMHFHNVRIVKDGAVFEI